MSFEPILQELNFRNLTVKNRIFRSNISGRFDNYDGSGNQARINWETKFAAGGVGAIITSFVPVHVKGRIMPGYAMINHDDKIPFWRKTAEAVHAHDAKFIMQLSHSGRQRDISGVENQYEKGLSSTNTTEDFHGLPSRAMSIPEIEEVVQYFAQAARRAKEAGVDGIELHGANGYLFTQFLSSAINDRKDKYGGPLENRARFALEVVRAIRKEVGPDFHLQFKISAQDYNNALFFWQTKGDGLEESTQVCKWLVGEGVDGFHVSTGNMFLHPRNPMGPFPTKEAIKWYDTMLSSGSKTMRNFHIFRNPLLRPIFDFLWARTQEKGDKIEGATLPDARAIRNAVHSVDKSIPVICTGGFQTGSRIAKAITDGDCDAVSIARPLVANNDMVRYFERGEEIPKKLRCTYCNKCLVNVLENPLGCYELSRFDNNYDKMMDQVMSVFKPMPFGVVKSEK